MIYTLNPEILHLVTTEIKLVSTKTVTLINTQLFDNNTSSLQFALALFGKM